MAPVELYFRQTAVNYCHARMTGNTDQNGRSDIKDKSGLPQFRCMDTYCGI